MPIKDISQLRLEKATAPPDLEEFEEDELTSPAIEPEGDSSIEGLENGDDSDLPLLAEETTDEGDTEGDLHYSSPDNPDQDEDEELIANIKKLILAYLDVVNLPSDTQFHALADALGIEPSDLETIAFDLLHEETADTSTQDDTFGPGYQTADGTDGMSDGVEELDFDDSQLDLLDL